MDELAHEQLAAVEKAVYQIYEIAVSNDAVELADGTVFHSCALAKHLAGCTSCAVLALTLGIGVDRALRRAQISSLTNALTLDMAANSLIEALCDRSTAQIAQAVRQQGMHITTRFSPGYGDFSLDYQLDLLRLTDAQKRIGLSLTDANLLLPQKSVTAIIGIRNTPITTQKTDKCAACSSREKCKQEQTLCKQAT